LIGIETYHKQGISSVQYAVADAAAMKDVLVQHFGVPAENITLWLDSDATRSALENDLPFMIRGLSPGDRFIFFYAGHGFYANGTNRLTTWDTHPDNLAGTTVSLEEVLLKPLKQQQGVDSLVFIDACAADLKTSVEQARDMVRDRAEASLLGDWIWRARILPLGHKAERVLHQLHGACRGAWSTHCERHSLEHNLSPQIHSEVSLLLWRSARENRVCG